MKYVKLILKKALRLKAIVFVFILLFVIDFILSKMFGESYGNSQPFAIWTFMLILLYIMIGFGAHLALAIRRSKKYHLIGWLILSFVILLAISFFANDKLSSWKFLKNILYISLGSIFVSGIILLLFLVRKIKKIINTLFSRIHSKKIALGVKIAFFILIYALIKSFLINVFSTLGAYLILIYIFLSMFYSKKINSSFPKLFGLTFQFVKRKLRLIGVFIFVCGSLLFILYQQIQINKLNNRFSLIETRLGGSEKIACNEKDSIEKIRKSVVRIVGGEAEGSGFAIQPGGVILTNFHVIEFEPSPKVILPDNSFYTGEILMADKNADLAIIQIDKDLPVISWGNPQKLNPAEELLAVGYPLGGDLIGEASVNKGSLSGRRKSKDVGVEYLQTDITLTGGVSGGPMINICGEVEGINTAGLAGLGLAISSDSIKQKWMEMSTSNDSLKDIKKIAFDDTTSADFAVATFYNYLKVRRLEKAFELLSDNFKQGHSFAYWKQGYASLLDTTVISINEDKTIKDRVVIKISTKNMVDDEIVYKYFEGYWDVKNINGKWRLWEPKIKEVENPDYFWFF